MWKDQLHEGADKWDLKHIPIEKQFIVTLKTTSTLHAHMQESSAHEYHMYYELPLGCWKNVKH